jgi:hypothetical protein
MPAAGIGRAAVPPFVRSKTWYSMSPSGARRTGSTRTVARSLSAKWRAQTSANNWFGVGSSGRSTGRVLAMKTLKSR